MRASNMCSRWLHTVATVVSCIQCASCSGEHCTTASALIVLPGQMRHVRHSAVRIIWSYNPLHCCGCERKNKKNKTQFPIASGSGIRCVGIVQCGRHRYVRNFREMPRVLCLCLCRTIKFPRYSLGPFWTQARFECFIRIVILSE